MNKARGKRQNDDGGDHSRLAAICILPFAFCIGAVGCFPKPNKANIELRKEVQSLESKVSELEAQRETDRGEIERLSADRTIQTLPAEKLDLLFRTSSLKFKNLVIGNDLDPNVPGDEGFKIGLVPVDEYGDEFKAAGSFKIELFDLAAPETRLGEWSIPTADAHKKWVSSFVFDGYVIELPWQTPPTHDKLLVKATFTDELSGRRFEAKADLTIRPPTQSAEQSSAKTQP